MDGPEGTMNHGWTPRSIRRRTWCVKLRRADELTAACKTNEEIAAELEVSATLANWRRGSVSDGLGKVLKAEGSQGMQSCPTDVNQQLAEAGSTAEMAEALRASGTVDELLAQIDTGGGGPDR